MKKKKVYSKKKKNKKTKKNKLKICLLGILIILIIISIIIALLVRKKYSNPDSQQAIAISEVIGKTAKKKFIKVADANNDIFYLPKGFKISEKVEEQTVKDGLVIIDDTGDSQTNGSEFVWIPVEDVNQIFSKNELIYRNLDSSLLEENNNTEEYLNIQKSISTYGGFYIARYEAGINGQMQQELEIANLLDERKFITQDTTEHFANGKYKPISKKESIVWNFIKWGGTFEEIASDNSAGNDMENGVVKVARSMYNTSKTSVKSNLCYGYQWDAIMNFLDSNYYNNSCEEASIIINSLDSGNYDGKLKKTASDENYSHKNIYDLAGNVGEWTMAGYSELYRVIRGGSYHMNGGIFSISSEKEFYPSDYYKDVGFRVSLWIEP